MMLEITNDYHIKKEEFFHILESMKSDNQEVQYNPITELSKNIFSSENEDIYLTFADMKELFWCHTDINIVTLSGDDIKEGLSYIAQTKEINNQESLCFHFHLHYEYLIQDISDAMESIYESTNEKANIAFCISSHKNNNLNKVKIDCFLSPN